MNAEQNGGLTVSEMVRDAMAKNGGANPGTDSTVPPTPQMPALAEREMPSITTDPLWFAKEEDYDDSNYDTTLGISRIRFYPSTTEKQFEKMILGKVNLNTPIMNIRDIMIWVKRLPQPIDGINFVVNVGNPSYFTNKWISDIKLTRAARAKIAKYVMTFIDQNSTGSFPNLTEPEDLWYDREDPGQLPDMTAEILTYGFNQATSKNQLNKGIFGKLHFNTLVASVSNCTVFANKLKQPKNGHIFQISVMDPSHKDNDGKQVSSLRMNFLTKKNFCKLISDMIEKNTPVQAQQVEDQAQAQ